MGRHHQSGIPAKEMMNAVCRRIVPLFMIAGRLLELLPGLDWHSVYFRDVCRWPCFLLLPATLYRIRSAGGWHASSSKGSS